MTTSQAMTAAPPPPVSRGKEYRVRPGDTLTAIARSHGTPVATLAAANGLSTRAEVQTGQTLLLPLTAPVVASGTKPVDKPAGSPEKPGTKAVEKVLLTEKALPKAVEKALPTEKMPPKEVIVPIASPFKTAAVAPAVPVRPTPTSASPQRQELTKAAAVESSQKRPTDARSLEEDFLRKHRVDQVVTRKLKPGETLASVAREVPGVPLWLLQRYNTHLDPKTARPGTELRIPKVVAKAF